MSGMPVRDQECRKTSRGVFKWVCIGFFGVVGSSIVLLLVLGFVVSNIITSVFGPVDASSSEELGIAYLEAKYGEDFRYVSGYGNSFDSDKTFFVECDSFPGEQVLIKVDGWTTDAPIFSDNYLALKYKRDVYDLLKELAADFWTDSFVYYDATAIVNTSDLCADATFEEYLLDGGTRVYSYIEVVTDVGTFREDMEGFLEALQPVFSDMKGELAIHVIVVKPDEFGIRTRRELGQVLVMDQAEDSCSIQMSGGELTRFDFQGE